ncbi:HAD family hydrolase [Pelagicoccus mobilis]|uniref:HAD family phosphatase n=1 Tax=Pelagicoccus mobilis TaxID=415221 RepID=A0A934VRQ6_9BACT|nr:HAD family phosphatase [Pelagicoccus mobilis]MBK1877729.1 HAD family phosphatase [Pelagicoccus mobilis]
MQTNLKLQAVIWDMDGLLFDTERLSYRAWQVGAEAIGLKINVQLFQNLIGMNSAAIMRKLKDELGEQTNVEELRRVAGIAYDELIAEGPPLKAGAVECLTLLNKLKVPQALATSSSYRYAVRKLNHHDLLEMFQATVTGDQVEHGKPHPAPYLLAADRLGIDPRHCIAFEDSVNGIHSAKQAGMRTILIPDMCPHNEESLARVDQQFETLMEAKEYLETVFS